MNRVGFELPTAAGEEAEEADEIEPEGRAEKEEGEVEEAAEEGGEEREGDDVVLSFSFSFSLPKSFEKNPPPPPPLLLSFLASVAVAFDDDDDEDDDDDDGRSEDESVLINEGRGCEVELVLEDAVFTVALVVVVVVVLLAVLADFNCTPPNANGELELFELAPLAFALALAPPGPARGAE